jgi:hypothetical protein
MLESLLAKRRVALEKRWLDAVLDTYPAEAARSMKRQQDRFANPAGHLVSDGIPILCDALQHGVVRENVEPPLEKILKLRALQDFTPSQAVQFLFVVKRLARETLAADVAAVDAAAVWDAFDTRVDALALVAFDVYMRCRERVYEVRYNQLKKMNYTMLERANRSLSRHGSSDEQGETESQQAPEGSGDRGDEA